MAHEISVVDKITGPGQMTFEQREAFLIEEEEAQKRIEARERRSDYKDWIQVNRDTNKKLITVGKESPSAPVIWNFFTAYIDKYNSIMVSYKAMNEILGIGRGTLTRGINALKDAGLIEVFKSGNSNIYVLNPDAVWKQWSKNKKYCKFNTSVIITFSEQEIETQKIIQERINKISLSDENEE